MGYEDLNDHDELRRDPLLAVLVEKEDPTGESRARERHRGKALAGKSTPNRLELTQEEVGAKERYKKIVMDAAEEERSAEGGDCPRTGRGGRRVSADGESGAALQGVQLPDAGQLVAGAAGGGQGGGRRGDEKGANPRFVVSSLRRPEGFGPQGAGPPLIRR
jgi:hypothetical protein